MNEAEKAPGTFGMTKRETICALAYLPVHLWLLPMLLGYSMQKGLSEIDANLLLYAVGALILTVTEFSYLRHDFDPLWEHPGKILLQVILCYGMMIGMNFMVALVFSNISVFSNPNNSSVMEMASTASGKTTAMAVFLAPIVEELIFRGGVFGALYRRSRIAAYLVSILLFSLYHVWSYALVDPTYLLYMLEYIPASFLLCLIYERTESIWSSILFHMLVNLVATKIAAFF